MPDAMRDLQVFPQKCLIETMRWSVQINDQIGEDILTDVLAEAGFTLDGDMLSGELFDACSEWGDVSDIAHDLAHRVREIARLHPDIEIGFFSGPVYEFDEDGKEIHRHNKVYAKGAAVLALSATVAGVGTVTSSLTAEERAEMERKARVQRAGELVKAAVRSDLVLTVMRLLDGEPGSLELGHVHDLLLDDMDGDLSSLASKKQLTRFNRSINHPDVLGLKARHAVTNQEAPPDPMSLEEATDFVRGIAQKWITEKGK